MRVPGLQPTSEGDGNLEDIAKAGSLHEFLMDLHKQFGPIASFWWKKRHVVSIASAELFAETQHMFDRAPEPFGTLRPLCEPKSINFCSKDEGHRRYQHYSRAFSEDAISFQPIQEVANELASKWSNLIGHDKVSLTRHLSNYALKATIHVLYANVMKDDSQDELEYMADIDEVWNEMERNFIKPIDKESKSPIREGETVLKKLTRKMIDDRKSNPAKKNEEILLDLFISVSEDEDVQLEDAMEFAMSGQYTLEYFLTCAFFNIATHPVVDERLQEEFKTVLGDEDINKDSVADLKYLRQVLDETLRCAVVAPWAAKFQEADMTLGGYDIPKHTYIFQALGVLMKSDDVWHDVDKFNPDRFSKENSELRSRFCFSPFGVGKRECLAKHFSYAAATVAMVTLLRKFKVELADDKQELIPIYGLVTHPKEEIFIKLSQR